MNVMKRLMKWLSWLLGGLLRQAMPATQYPIPLTDEQKKSLKEYEDLLTVIKYASVETPWDRSLKAAKEKKAHALYKELVKQGVTVTNLEAVKWRVENSWM